MGERNHDPNWSRDISSPAMRTVGAVMSILASSPAPVKVFDNVFDPEALNLLRPVAAAAGLGHTLYDRQAPPRTPLEAAMDSVLEALGDDAAYVEYWSRQEWKHIEAHSDVDEALASSTGQLRFPRHGHVLYLEVGERVKGPTCVWHPHEPAAAPSPAEARFGALTAVPAVAGRCLRFDGELQHAVPRPADVWLSSFVINEPSTPPEAYVRSVVLFNTWPDPEAPPQDVDREPTGVACTGAEGLSLAHCLEREAWEEVPISQPSPHEDARARMKLWLLGDEARRLQPSRTVTLDVPSDTLSALSEPHAVTQLV